MQVYVITPVGPDTKTEHLDQCVASVAGQQHPGVQHVLVGDGCHLPPNGTDHHIELPYNAGDIGSTPRTVGVAYAWGQDADAVAFLDADCYYLPDHLSRLVAYQAKTTRPIVCSGRYVIDLHETDRRICPEMTPGSAFYDTNTFLITRAAIGVSYTYGMLSSREEHKIGDRILSQRCASSLACHYLPTVVYRSIHEFHYQRFNWPVPMGVTLKNLSRHDPPQS